MLVLIDEREIVSVGYVGGFRNEGVSSTGLKPTDFRDWVSGVSDGDLAAVEAFLIGACAERHAYPRHIRERSSAPIIAINETHSLEQTLDLFNAGFDDVVRKPIHVRELMARIDAIRRRAQAKKDDVQFGDIRVFFDGRDPEIRGEALSLPRRERRILEYLVKNRGRRVTKTQIFNAIYGIFDEQVEENVVESHISKLRKKLRERLGYDLIESKRYLGYCLEERCGAADLAPVGSILAASFPARALASAA
jgi:two-component system, OmpR family, flagellar system response regulator FtcR